MPVPHQREPADKGYEAKAVVEDGGNVWAVEEDVFLESYEEVCSVDDGYERENGGSSCLMMFGRLKKHAKFWEEMGASKFILSVIKDGYRLPFVRSPPAGRLRNQRSCDDHEAFVNQAVKDLLECGSAVEVKQEFTKCVSPLGVVQGASKLRLILDLRQVNNCLSKPSFKLEDIRTAAKIYRKGDFVVTFDLKSGYHHVDIAEEHWKYLCFEWKEKFYCFRSLPFGLSTAPHLFNKMVRVMVRYWRAMGIRCMMFFDDGSAGGESEMEGKKIAATLKDTLQRAGWVANEEKSCWEPSQKPKILGFVLDLLEGKVFVTEKRVNGLEKKWSLIMSSRKAN